MRVANEIGIAARVEKAIDAVVTNPIHPMRGILKLKDPVEQVRRTMKTLVTANMRIRLNELLMLVARQYGNDPMIIAGIRAGDAVRTMFNDILDDLIVELWVRGVSKTTIPVALGDKINDGLKEVKPMLGLGATNEASDLAAARLEEAFAEYNNTPNAGYVNIFNAIQHLVCGLAVARELTFIGTDFFGDLVADV